MHIRRLNNVIEEQKKLIETLTQTPVAVEEQDHSRVAPTDIRLPTADILKKLAKPDSGDLQHGIKAFMRGNYRQAAEIIPRFAEQDHVKAQTILAKMYFSGNGFARDMQKYEYWLQRAADNGHKPSKAKLKKLKKREPTSERTP